MPSPLVQPVAVPRSLRATLLIEAPPDSRPDRMRVPQIRVVQISPAALLVPVPARPASPVYGRCLAGLRDRVPAGARPARGTRAGSARATGAWWLSGSWKTKRQGFRLVARTYEK